MPDGRLHDHDLALGGVDEADAQAIDIPQPFGGRAPLGVDPEEEPLGVEAEPDALEHALGDQRHGPPVVAAEVAGRVDPLEVGGPAVDLDVQEAGRLVVDRPVAAGLGDRREQEARGIAAQERVDVAEVLAEEVVEEARPGRCCDRRRTTRTSPSPRRCRSPPRREPATAGSCRPVRSSSTRNWRVECRASQPRLSSGWPIQMAKLWLIQLPANSRCRVSWGGCSRRNSPAFTGRMRGSRATLW